MFEVIVDATQCEFCFTFKDPQHVFDQFQPILIRHFMSMDFIIKNLDKEIAGTLKRMKKGVSLRTMIFDANNIVNTVQ